MAVFAAAALHAQTPQTLIENDSVRVLKVVENPHSKTALHDHKLNRVMVYLTEGSQEFTPQKGSKSTATYKAGEARWSPATGSHIVETTSNSPLAIIEVELKKPGDPSKKPSATQDPLKIDPKDYTLEFENSQVRVSRVKIAPHGKIPQHEHTMHRVVVCLADVNVRLTLPDGKTAMSQVKAGEASWGAPGIHSEESLNATPSEAVIIEVKN
jgi:quercetin dioxygenase-like cupin family protein